MHLRSETDTSVRNAIDMQRELFEVKQRAHPPERALDDFVARLAQILEPDYEKVEERGHAGRPHERKEGRQRDGLCVALCVRGRVGVARRALAAALDRVTERTTTKREARNVRYTGNGKSQHAAVSF